MNLKVFLGIGCHFASLVYGRIFLEEYFENWPASWTITSKSSQVDSLLWDKGVVGVQSPSAEVKAMIDLDQSFNLQESEIILQFVATLLPSDDKASCAQATITISRTNDELGEGHLLTFGPTECRGLILDWGWDGKQTYELAQYLPIPHDPLPHLYTLHLRRNPKLVCEIYVDQLLVSTGELARSFKPMGGCPGDLANIKESFQLITPKTLCISAKGTGRSDGIVAFHSILLTDDAKYANKVAQARWRENFELQSLEYQEHKKKELLELEKQNKKISHNSRQRFYINSRPERKGEL